MACEQYASLAAFYDRLTDDVAYTDRATYLHGLLRDFSAKAPHSLLDLACGSGSLTVELAALGYDMTGVDLSTDMLALAMEKETDSDILWLCQDMRDLDLYDTVDAAVCTLDSINHLLTVSDIREVLERLRLFIGPHGLFVFDVNTPYNHREELGDNDYIYELDDVVCCWRNRYTPRNAVVDMQLDLFVEQNGSYERMTDYIRERAYSRRTLENVLRKTGFEVLAVYNDMTRDEADDGNSRWVFVAQNTREEQDYE